MDRHRDLQQNITPLFPGQPTFPDQPTMNNPVLVDLLNYWEHLRAGRIAPLRSEIDPRKIENALEYTFILERMATGDLRFRIAGMHLCELMGMEVRGMPPTALIVEQDRKAFDQIVSGMFDAPEVIELGLRSTRPGLPELAAHMLLLPMKSDLGEISRILGCLVSGLPPISTPPSASQGIPCRFGIHSKKITRIIASEANERRDPLPGFSEDIAIYDSPQAGKGQSGRRAHLRLVK